MVVDKKVLLDVAKNARLDASEMDDLVKDVAEILDNFSKIDEVDTEGVPLSCQPVDVKNHVREDEPKECLSQEEALSNTEHKKDGYFKGPRSV